MAKIKIIFLVVCVLAELSYIDHNSNYLINESGLKIVEIARSQLDVRELTGNNDGRMVEAYLRYTGLSKGNPWCAAFVSWVYAKAGFDRPKTAWSPALFPGYRLTHKIRSGFVYGLYDPKKRRIVHCGISIARNGDWVEGIEGNTNALGSVDGDGVYLKRRHRLTIHAIADWISEKGGKDEE